MLSGGERNRLLLAKLFAKPSNLLIMDEPTNDLDAETLDLVEEMVADYAGTLLLVSHDRAFLDNVVTGTLVFDGGGRIDEYVGGYSDSIRQRGERRAAAAPGASTPGATAPAARGAAARKNVDRPGAAPAPARPRSAPRAKPRKLSFNEQRELESLPAVIERLEAEQTALQSSLSDPALFQERPAEARAAAARLQELMLELAAAYERWAALESTE
jgi:ATP-binding cassette subfamily F protein uup